MKIKLICIDIDGTLIGDNAAISEETKQTLVRMRKKGYIIAFCSGRCMIDLRNFDPEGAYSDYNIAFNGALIEDHQEKIYAEPLNMSIIRRLMESAKEYNAQPTLCTSDRYFYGENKVLQEEQFLAYLKRNNKEYSDFLKVERIYVADPDDWDRICMEFEDSIYKIEVCCTDMRVQNWIEGEIRNMKDEIEASLFDGNAYGVAPHYEMTKAGVDKASGIQWLQRHLNIRREEIAAIGDGANDIPAIQYAGLGIAMANSTNEVKTSADYITDSNLEEGAKKALEYIEQFG